MLNLSKIRICNIVRTLWPQGEHHWKHCGIQCVRRNNDKMADTAKDTFRRMEYPYTWTAKVVNFPWKFYFTKQWLWKTLPFGLLITSPLFYKISQASNSEGNVAKWREVRKKDREAHHD